MEADRELAEESWNEYINNTGLKYVFENDKNAKFYHDLFIEGYFRALSKVGQILDGKETS